MSGEPLFAPTEQQLRRIVKQLLRDEYEPREDLQYRPPPHYHAIDHLAGTAYETITARAGDVPGTGQVQAKAFTSGTAADYANTASNLVDVLNFGPQIASGSYVICHRHRESGKWAIQQNPDRSVRYLIGSGTIGAGANAIVGITGENVTPTGGIFTYSSGEAIIAPIGRYEAGFSVGYGNSGSKTEVVPVQADLQQYITMLTSWATLDTARGYYLGNLVSSDKPVTLTGTCIFETTEANQHIRVLGTNLGATDTVTLQNYSHLWIRALD